MPALSFPLAAGRRADAAPTFSMDGLGSKAIGQKRINHSSKHNSQQKSSCKQVKLSYPLAFRVLRGFVRGCKVVSRGMCSTDPAPGFVPIRKHEDEVVFTHLSHFCLQYIKN